MIINRGSIFFRECTIEESNDFEKDYDIDFFQNHPGDITIDGKIGLDEIFGYPIQTVCADFRGGYCAAILENGQKKFFEFWID